MSVLGAVVMPHNLFIHSESIQSREFNINDKKLIKQQIKYAKTDTLLSMIVGFLINSAIVILAAAVFHGNGIVVTQIEQAQELLVPLLGNASAKIFAIAFLFAGIASSVTAIMTGGIISAGMAGERYNANDKHTSTGIIVTTIIAIISVMFVTDTFQGLILSQVLLSIQLPITIITLIYLTNSKKVMREFVNTKKEKIILTSIGVIVIALNIVLLWITFTS
jgi:manganese transport protein